ncbi:MAG: DNRLRE domain-containing protein, partial [Chitinivibrionales bacterium]|nr:DNRLRE domain-containing protein [Chitinivibrionales bacterium]
GELDFRFDEGNKERHHGMCLVRHGKGKPRNELGRNLRMLHRVSTLLCTLDLWHSKCFYPGAYAMQDSLQEWDPGVSSESNETIPSTFLTPRGGKNYAFQCRTMTPICKRVIGVATGGYAHQPRPEWVTNGWNNNKLTKGWIERMKQRMKMLNYGLIALAVMVQGFAGHAWAGTMTIGYDAAAYVASFWPNTNMKGTGDLLAGNSWVCEGDTLAGVMVQCDDYTDLNAYVRFDLSALPPNAVITDATLIVDIGWAVNAYDAGLDLGISSNDWDENLITYNNAPGYTTVGPYYSYLHENHGTEPEEVERHSSWSDPIFSPIFSLHHQQRGDSVLNLLLEPLDVVVLLGRPFVFAVGIPHSKNLVVGAVVARFEAIDGPTYPGPLLGGGEFDG